MSELHSESNNRNLGLTVRIKLVDLNYTGISSTAPSNRISGESTSRERLTAIVGVTSEQTLRPLSAGTQPSHRTDYSIAETCMLTGERIAIAEFETHIETCSICANRIELQLDFMETLEVAVYQRKIDPASDTVRGAMLISAPELNFAVCGELEIG